MLLFRISLEQCFPSWVLGRQGNVCFSLSGCLHSHHLGVAVTKALGLVNSRQGKVHLEILKHSAAFFFFYLINEIKGKIYISPSLCLCHPSSCFSPQCNFQKAALEQRLEESRQQVLTDRTRHSDAVIQLETQVRSF